MADRRSATVKKSRATPARKTRSAKKRSARGKVTRSSARASEGPAATAVTMATKQRDISVSEVFAKNRHLLGFDNPAKALLTTVKEGVDNSLDACEEARVLPDIRVEIVQISDTRFRIAIEDNGPGIVRAQVPKIFGRLLERKLIRLE